MKVYRERERERERERVLLTHLIRHSLESFLILCRDESIKSWNIGSKNILPLTMAQFPLESGYKVFSWAEGDENLPYRPDCCQVGGARLEAEMKKKYDL